MSDHLIKPDVISGFTVYGVPQVQYAVESDQGLDYTSAVTIASFRQATAIELSCTGYSEVVKARQKKIDDLGDVLAYIAKANAQLPPNSKTTDKVKVDHATWIKSICSGYDISLSWDGEKMSYGDLQKAQTELEYQIDKEDNYLQQDMVTLESYITKRDNAFSNASKVVKKTLSASDSVIRNMGR